MSKTDCPDCGVHPGSIHEPYCEHEQCPFCGMQLLTCGCLYRQNGLQPEEVDEDRVLTADEINNAVKKAEMQGRIPWSGNPMGYDDCREYGYYTPDFEVDYHQLHFECKWDRGQQKFIPKARS